MESIIWIQHFGLILESKIPVCAVMGALKSLGCVADWVMQERRGCECEYWAPVTGRSWGTKIALIIDSRHLGASCPPLASLAGWKGQTSTSLPSLRPKSQNKHLQKACALLCFFSAFTGEQKTLIHFSGSGLNNFCTFVVKLAPMGNYFTCLWVSQLYVKTLTLRISPSHYPEPLSSQFCNPDSFPVPCQTLKCHSTWFLCFQLFPKQTVEAETSWVFTQSDATVSPNLSCLSRHWRQVCSLRGPCLSISALCHVLESGSWGLMVRTCPLGGRRLQREGGLDSKGLWLQFDLPFLSSYSKKNMYVYIKIIHTHFSLNIDPEIVFLIWGLFLFSLFLQSPSLSLPLPP